MNDQFKIERAQKRREKNRQRFYNWRSSWKPRNNTEHCFDCGGTKTWCEGCRMYTQLCCEQYGTCMCS
jgi:hypothetical protein